MNLHRNKFSVLPFIYLFQGQSKKYPAINVERSSTLYAISTLIWCTIKNQRSSVIIATKFFISKRICVNIKNLFIWGSRTAVNCVIALSKVLPVYEDMRNLIARVKVLFFFSSIIDLIINH